MPGETGIHAVPLRIACERIARLAGRRFAPRGGYCYDDAWARRWDEFDSALWQDVRAAGLEHVIPPGSPARSRLIGAESRSGVLSQAIGKILHSHSSLSKTSGE